MKRPLRYHLTRLGLPLLALLTLLYFTYHFIEGEHGLRAWRVLEKQLAYAESVLKEKTAVQEALSHRVDLLRSEHLDPDLLEERVRVMLNHAGPEEVVVLYEGENTSS